MISARKAGIVGVAALTVAALSVTTASAQSKPSPAKPGPANTVTITGKKAAAPPSFAQTICYGGVSNGAVIPWYGAPVTASHPVAVSATEGTMGAEHIGSAPISTSNVQVVNSAVIVRVHTGWKSPLNVCLHYVG